MHAARADQGLGMHMYQVWQTPMKHATAIVTCTCALCRPAGEATLVILTSLSEVQTRTMHAMLTTWVHRMMANIE